MKHVISAWILLVVIACFSPVSPLFAQGNPIRLTENGTSGYTIVIPSNATQDETNAANILKKYITQISGAVLPIVSDATPPKPQEILIGRNNRLDRLKAGISFQKLDQDGFTIKTVGNKLVLAGGDKKGNTYAAYSLLEEYIGCRKFTPDFSVVPHMASIIVPAITDNTQIPHFKLRAVNYFPCNNEYGDWNKIDELNRNPDWGAWVEPFTALIPATQYFSSHPEYFALYNGKRVPDQLCMTNEDVFNIVVQNLKKMMAQNPNAKYWTVCQNDAQAHCQCVNCKRLDDEYGSPQGSLLTMINRIAKEFPDKIIATHAYNYSVTPPKNGLKPGPNVLIILSTIFCGRTEPIASDPVQSGFRQAIDGWSKLTNNLYIWDYVVQFSNFESLFPDQQTLQPNARFFAQNNVSGVFSQASGYVPADFSELNSYMIAKLLWNPACDINAIQQEFIGKYYGAAASDITKYLSLRESALVRSGKTLGIYDKVTSATQSFLTPDLIRQYNQLFDDAERQVQSDAVSLDHVKMARLSLEYAIIALTKTQGKMSLPGVDVDQTYNRFVSDCKKYHVDLLSNFGGEYRVANLIRDAGATK